MARDSKIKIAASIATTCQIEDPKVKPHASFENLVKMASRKRKGSANKAASSASLPDLATNMSVSAIRQLPAAALKRYAERYNLPGEGNKSTLAQRLHDYLHTDSGDSEPSNSEENSQEITSEGDKDSPSSSSSSSSPEGECTPSRPRRKRKRQSIRAERTRRHKQCNRTLTISPPSDHSDRTHKRHTKRRHCRSRRSPSSSDSLSSSSSGSSVSRSSSSTSSSSTSPSRSPIRRHCFHHRRTSHSHTHHGRSTHKHRLHQRRRESATVPLPHRVQRAIERGEFIDFSDLLAEHLTRAGKSAKTKKATQTRHIASLDMWLEAWTLYATVLTNAKPQLAPELFKYQAFITKTSQRFQPYAWLQYDSQFRLKLAADKFMRWSAADPELTATWLSADATKAKQPCFSCGSPDHLAPHCPLKAQVAAPGLRCPICNHVGHTARDCSLLPRENVSNVASQPSVSQPTNDDNICRVYNKRAFCFRGAKCPYLHICTACREGHPQRTCPRQAQ